MADYVKRYRLSRSPTARNDGSGHVDHDIYAIAAVQGSDEWFVIPGRHKTVSVPAADLSAALASGTNSQKVQAYKNLLAANLNTIPEPITGWGLNELEMLLDNNDAASAAAAEADAFVQTVAGSYPVDFNM